MNRFQEFDQELQGFFNAGVGLCLAGMVLFLPAFLLLGVVVAVLNAVVSLFGV